MKKWIFAFMAVSLAACEADYTGLAPVEEGHWHSAYPAPNRYIVRPGDTLYSIAFRYDQDYRHLAQLNHLQSPYVVKVGQPIVLNVRYAKAHGASSKSTVRSAAHRSAWRPTPTPVDHAFSARAVPKNSHWLWPTRGPIIAGFAPAMGKKGIDIAGSQGQTVRATASGMVAYSGDGLPGYGNMILIQHAHQLLSAYGYNARNLVHAGQRVEAGQAIAIMGTGPQHRYATHFELRKAGKPVNPRYFLR